MINRGDNMMDTVVLNYMNGLQFRMLCAELFKGLGYCEVRLVHRKPGMWADITAVSPEGKRVAALCIHRLGRGLGKEEIYRLYKTILDSSIDKGILVTTACLSNNVIQFVEELSGRVEVWDLPKLLEKADEAGIKLGEITYTTKEMALPALPTHKVVEYIMKELSKIKNFIPWQLRVEIKTKIEYLPVYAVKCRITGIKSNHVGETKYWESLQTIYVDGTNGRPLNHLNVYDAMPPEPIRRAEDHIIKDFGLTPEQAILNIHAILGERYAGIEFQEVDALKDFRVTKTTTNDFHAEILSITQLMLPIHNIEIKILNTKYTFKCYTRPPDQIYIVHNELTWCRECHKELPLIKMGICNTCGRIIHLRAIKRFAYMCWNCLRIVCDRCAAKRRKWLIIPVKYCIGCLQEEMRKDMENANNIK
jgi:hypothetical protein